MIGSIRERNGGAVLGGSAVQRKVSHYLLTFTSEDGTCTETVIYAHVNYHNTNMEQPAV